MSKKMFDDAIFEELRKKFKETKAGFNEIISEVRSRAVKTVYSKGELHNVLPFENELMGSKVSGRVIPNEIIDDNCNRYSYDDKGRVILKENMSSFLKMFFYDTDNITTMYWSYYDLSNITRYEMKNGRPNKAYSVAIGGERTADYIYNGNELAAVEEEYTHESMRRKLCFYYKKDGKLLKIIGRYENGYSNVCFTSEKINYKKLEERLFESLVGLFSDTAKN